ncbi:MAG TPA: hypothetical protein DCS82_07760 [Rhodospirillaceae bacterium]|nr:hypothetical protein [Rhodospirillaceae bacterium]
MHLSKIESSPRILNVNLITSNLKREKGEELNRFFHHNVLNQLIIIKHRLRPGEEEYFTSTRYSATKIFLPYNPGDLRDGGKFAFLGEDDITEKMKFEFTIDIDDHDDKFRADIKLLEIVESLPSLDPFLLKTSIERLNASNDQFDIEIDEGYFEVSLGDYEKIRSFVTDEFVPLAEAAFGKSAKTPDRARQIADKMWTGTDHSFLMPICLLLDIKGDSVTDILFSWKGVLYYKFIATSIEKRMMEMLKGLRVMVPSGVQDLNQKDYLDELRNDLINSFIEMMKVIKKQITAYDRIYKEEFITKHNGAALKELLENAPSLFGSLGASIGSVSHACSYWEYQYAKAGVLRCAVDEYIAMIEDFSDGITTAREYASL